MIRKQFEDMKTENKFIGFADELYRHQYSEPFNRLNMKGDKYFNAGVMLVDFLNWDKNNLTKKSLDAINELKDKVKFWDRYFKFYYRWKLFEFRFTTKLQN